MYDDALRQDELHWEFHLLHRRTDGVSALTLSTINQSSINSSHPTKLHTALSLPYFAVTPAHLLAARYLVLFFFLNLCFTTLSLAPAFVYLCSPSGTRLTPPIVVCTCTSAKHQTTILTAN